MTALGVTSLSVTLVVVPLSLYDGISGITAEYGTIETTGTTTSQQGTGSGQSTKFAVNSDIFVDFVDSSFITGGAVGYDYVTDWGVPGNYMGGAQHQHIQVASSSISNVQVFT